MFKKILAAIMGFLALFWRNKAKKEELRADTAEAKLEDKQDVLELERKLNDSLKETRPLPTVKEDKSVEGRSDKDIFGNNDWNDS